MAALLVALGLGTGCALVMQRSADELRRQQNGSEPDADGSDSHRRKGKSPWRAVVHTAAYDAADGLVDGAVDATKDPKRREQLRTLGDDLETRVESVAASAGAGIIDGVNARLPATQPILVEMFEQLRKELGIDPEQTGRKLVRGAMAEARTGIHDLRPEVRRLLEKDVQIGRAHV